MTKRFFKPIMKILTFIAVIGLGLAGCATRSGPAQQSEPMYHGKALSSWVMELQNSDPTEKGFKPPADAAKAIQSIGPPAVPYLLTWLLLPDHPSTGVGRLNSPPPPRLPQVPTQHEVAAAFRIMGKQGKSAIPILERIVSATPIGPAGYGSFYDGCLALGFLGPEAAPAMVRAAKRHQDRDSSSERQIIFHLGWTRADGEVAVEPLTEWAKDKDRQIRSAAVQYLGAIARRPDLAIPALIAALKDTDPYIRVAAAFSLGQFRGDAQAAIPELSRLADDPDSQIAEAAKEALVKIDPMDAKKPWVK